MFQIHVDRSRSKNGQNCFSQKHRSFLSLFLFRHGLKSEPEEISQKFNFLLKGIVSKQFLKTFGALNERPARNVMKKFKNG